MKKLFISQPMQGKSKEEILAERKSAICQAKEAVGTKLRSSTVTSKTPRCATGRSGSWAKA